MNYNKNRAKALYLIFGGIFWLFSVVAQAASLSSVPKSSSSSSSLSSSSSSVGHSFALSGALEGRKYFKPRSRAVSALTSPVLHPLDAPGSHDSERKIEASQEHPAVLEQERKEMKVRRLSTTEPIAQSEQCLLCLEFCTDKNPNVQLPCLSVRKRLPSDKEGEKTVKISAVHPLCRDCCREAISAGGMSNGSSLEMACILCKRIYNNEDFEHMDKYKIISLESTYDAFRKMQLKQKEAEVVQRLQAEQREAELQEAREALQDLQADQAAGRAAERLSCREKARLLGTKVWTVAAVVAACAGSKAFVFDESAEKMVENALFLTGSICLYKAYAAVQKYLGME